MSLTDRQIRTARVSEGLSQIELRDDQVRGLLLRVYAGGARTWMLAYRRREANRRRQLKLGDYPGVSLKQARQLAEVEVGQVATGHDPKGERDDSVRARWRRGQQGTTHGHDRVAASKSLL